MEVSIPLGARVSVASGIGAVRFLGQTAFAAGKWVGIELDEPNGKNDGTVAGKRYFQSKNACGVFVRPSQVVLLEVDSSREESPTPSKPPTRPTASSRSSSVASSPVLSRSTSSARQAVGLGRPTLPVSGRTSVASLASASRTSPLKPPAPVRRTLSNSSSASAVPARVLPPSRPPSAQMLPPLSTVRSSGIRPTSPIKPRASIAPSRQVDSVIPRTSSALSDVSSTISGITRPRASSILSNTSTASRRLLVSPPPITSRRISPSPGTPTINALVESHSLTEPLMGEASPERLYDSPVAVEKVDPYSLKAVDSRKLAEATVPKREHEELQAKLRILETRRAEDRDRLRTFEKMQEDSEEWIRVREKSKQRIVELATEARELRQKMEEAESERDEYKNSLADLTFEIEESVVDKEVAEERAEAAESALATEQEKVVNLEVEVKVLRDETARLDGDGSVPVPGEDSGRDSLAYVQLERQNNRLKDALARLRDITAETEAEQRHKIAALDNEIKLASAVEDDYAKSINSLALAHDHIEDLKEQLDDALGEADMLEHLTERNLTLEDKNEELITALEDLEQLREINDEIELNHNETEKQMQDEIDLKDLHLQDQRRRCTRYEESIADYDATVGQFRELVLSLQADLEQVRAHQANKETESESLTSQSKAMLSLNLKLQSSMLKGQVKTIDLEMRKLDTLQAVEHLSIVKPYLLPSFMDEDCDAVDALLFFERMAYKADLLSSVIESNHSVADSLNGTVPENLVGICEIRVKLARYSALNKRFAVQLRRCAPEVFLRMGHIYREVSSTEKRLDAFIELLRKEHLREAECGREIDGLIAQVEHLATLHLQESLLDLVERETSFIAVLDLDLDTIAAAVGFTKQALVTIIQDSDVVLDLRDADLDEVLFEPLQSLLNQSRNAKITTKKLLRRLGDLAVTSSALNESHTHGIETLAYNGSAIASAVSRMAMETSAYCLSIRTSKRSFDLESVLSIAREVAASELGKTTNQPLQEMISLLDQLSQDASTTLATSLESEHVVHLAFTPPWTARVKELHGTAALNGEAERRAINLAEEKRDLVREMHLKEQAYQESAVRIDTMEKRMESVKKQASDMILLEKAYVKSKESLREHEEAIGVIQADLDKAIEENSKLRLNLPALGAPGATKAGLGQESNGYEGNLETARLVEQIESLRGAVRFLRAENSVLKSQELLEELEELPLYSSPPPTPDPTGLPPTRLVPFTRRIDSMYSLASESKRLVREARVLSATPRLVDLSFVQPGAKIAWQAGHREPEAQLRIEKERARLLARRVELLGFKSRGL